MVAFQTASRGSSSAVSDLEHVAVYEWFHYAEEVVGLRGHEESFASLHEQQEQCGSVAEEEVVKVWQVAESVGVVG